MTDPDPGADSAAVVKNVAVTIREFDPVSAITCFGYRNKTCMFIAIHLVDTNGLLEIQAQQVCADEAYT